MATIHEIVTGTQTVTAVGPVTGTLDTSALDAAGDYMIELTVVAFSASAGTPQARILIEDTANAFTDTLPIAVDNIQGPVVADAPITHSWKRDRIPRARIGEASAKIRVNVVELQGTGASLSLSARLYQ